VIIGVKIKNKQMKRFKFLPVAIVLVLVVAAIGCTPLRETEGDEYYERVSSAPGRIYVDDPYRGTVVLERDPYTGRYYEVGSYSRYGTRYRGYDPYYGGGYNYPRTNRTYRTQRQTPAPKPPTQEEIRQQQQNKNDARNKVLGGKS
jgi:hypothetical protein